MRVALTRASSRAALRVGQVAFGLVDARLENGGIDLGDHLPAFTGELKSANSF